MEMNERNVFLTGATGFIGSRLARELSNMNANLSVLIIDDIPSKIEDEIRHSLRAIVRGSITDYATVERCINENDAEVVYHLAAQTIVGVANKSPIPTFESNIIGTWNVLEAARMSETVESIVIASSDKAYGEHRELPYTEGYSLRGLHPYDVSKACVDLLAQSYHHTYGLPVTISRCANIYGGGDMNFSRIVPSTIQSLIRNERPVIRSDGTPVRDYLYINDAVSGYISLANEIRKTKGEAFNLGSNSPIAVIKLVNKIVEIYGSRLQPLIMSKGKLQGEIQEQYLSIDKARNVLGWMPKYTLEDGLKETIAWYREHLK